MSNFTLFPSTPYSSFGTVWLKSGNAVSLTVSRSYLSQSLTLTVTSSQIQTFRFGPLPTSTVVTVVVHDGADDDGGAGGRRAAAGRVHPGGGTGQTRSVQLSVCLSKCQDC